MAIRVSCPFVVGGRAGSPRVALHVAPRPGSPHRTARLSLAVHRIGGTSGHRHLRWGRGWRNGSGGRGCAGACGARRCGRRSCSRSSSTPCCCAPCRSPGDTAPDIFAAVLLAFFFNLVVVAVGAPLAGRLVRRRRPGLPQRRRRRPRGHLRSSPPSRRVLLAVGLVHHPVVQARARAFDLQAAAARAFVLDRAPTAFRGQRRADGHVDAGHRTSTARASPGRGAPVVLRVRRHPARSAARHRATPTRARTPCSRGPTTRAGRRGRASVRPERPTARARSAAPGSP